MAKIKIVTDSTADISMEVREALGIEMIPLKVHFGEETYRDGGIDITSEQFYAKLTAASEMPTTSQPSPADFMDMYKKLSDDPDTQIISIHLAAILSGTYQSAVMAKSMLEEEGAGGGIHIVDSRSASYGHGMMAVVAAKQAMEGKSVDEILASIEKLRSECRIYFIVDTLQYLHKGGRIGKASALFGSLLNIKPILTLDDSGQVTPVDKVRGHKKALKRIVDMLKDEFGTRKVRLAVAHSEALESAKELFGMINEELNVELLQYTNLGPVIGTHTGPGTLAVFVYPE
jgi:DegV family protein with EDD domain